MDLLRERTARPASTDLLRGLPASAAPEYLRKPYIKHGYQTGAAQVHHAQAVWKI